jgi:hypothetical protein
VSAGAAMPGVEIGVEAVVAEVDRDRLMAHCAEFAKRVKLSGTPEERESFLYLEAACAAMGFRTQLLDHDAYISLPGEARVVVEGRDLTAITHSFSLPSGEGGLTAPLIDLGAGRAEDFAARDCRGRIVLVDGIASPAAAALARAAGAAGQLHVSPHEHLHEMCISPVWGSPSEATLGQMPTTVVCTVSLADGQALRARLAEAQDLAVTLHAAVDTGWRTTPLLVADMDGAGGEDAPFVLLSGHHDTWYYGVMDNGSANATMLEAARVAAAHRASWRRGLRICFWSGHSHGRYSGSTWYVDQHHADLDRRCVAHVNVDSTGGVGATDMGSNGVVATLAELARDATAAVTGEVHHGKRPSRSSDQSFWGIGIPSMFGSVSQQPPGGVAMRNALGWWWHTPHDTLDKVDPDFLLRDTRVVAHALWRLLADPVLPLRPVDELDALAAELEGLRRGPAAALADELLAAAARVREAAAGATSDAAMMALCRALVSLDYARADRFAHDPALPVPAWPALEPIRALAAAEAGTDRARFLAVDAVRARNRVRAALEAVGRAS